MLFLFATISRKRFEMRLKKDGCNDILVIDILIIVWLIFYITVKTCDTINLEINSTDQNFRFASVVLIIV